MPDYFLLFMVFHRAVASLLLLSVLFYACGEKQGNAENIARIPSDTQIKQDSLAQLATREEAKAPLSVHYSFVPKSVWKQKDSFEGFTHKALLAAVNRVDVEHLMRLDSFLVPDIYEDSSLADYMHFPASVNVLTDVDKIIIFSYRTQTFAAYRNGRRVFSGPTNMGKKSTPTPTGLFFCNWKSKETRSTVDKSWILKWNFNVSNFGGVGFHQYDLPGYPASHSCMRLWASQAEQLYYWADQWKLDGQQKLLAKGTPVIIYGEYPFGKPRPWFSLVQNPEGLDISESEIAELFEKHKEDILAAQAQRKQYVVVSADTLLAAVK